MSRKRKYVENPRVDYTKCFCCDGSLGDNKERHHFPIPHHSFGEEYVNVCVDCHDLTDRKNLINWSSFILNHLYGNHDRLLSPKAIEILQAVVTTQTDQLNDFYGDKLENYVEHFQNVLYDFSEEDAWELIDGCKESGRPLAMKLISYCFNLQ